MRKESKSNSPERRLPPREQPRSDEELLAMYLDPEYFQAAVNMEGQPDRPSLLCGVFCLGLNGPDCEWFYAGKCPKAGFCAGFVPIDDTVKGIEDRIHRFWKDKPPPVDRYAAQAMLAM